jgi:pimeloyl-ACP methyl ester carboxylesterase/RimJ/RimL family protein N-acetyltransferase
MSIIIFTGLIILALIAIILLVLFATKNTSTRQFLDQEGNIIKDSVAEELYLPLGGIDQWILLRGQSIKNLIFIFLHGGPGISLHGLFRHFYTDLEKHFIIVGWDQRGAGKSYSTSIPPESLKLDTFVNDLHELIQWLKKRFNQDKVYILGESWGSLLGITYAHRYPEDVLAYIGTGQISNMQEAQQRSYEFTLMQAQKQNNQKALSQLHSMKQPPCDALKDRLVLSTWLMKLGGILYQRTSYPLSWFIGMLRTDEYAWPDLLKIGPGVKLSLTNLWPEIFQANLFIQIPELKVPVYFLLGRHDYNTSSLLAEKYFNALKAPKKELVWFEHSGHNPVFEEPELFRDALLSIRYTITFKPLEEKDLPLFFAWVKKPHIAQWWKSDTYEKFVEKYQPQIITANYCLPFIMYINEKPIGYIQYCLADKADDGWWCKQHGQPAGTIGMDIIIGETDYVGKGFGPMLIKKFAEKIFTETNAPKIIIDPDTTNQAAIRCYEKVGFKRVNEIDAPSFFDTPDGKLLLMEFKRNI